jgi:drug/metabolite transporter (DMT)-like permease
MDMASTRAPILHPAAPPSAFALTAGVLLLFSVWSCSFIAMEYLLHGTAGSAANAVGKVQFGWAGLTAARFFPVGIICAVYCFGFHRAESVRIIRERWGRLLLSAALNVWCYNSAMYFAIKHGVASPVASLLTALSPLFLMLLSAAFLNERLTARRILGFTISLAGVIWISQSKENHGEGDLPYALLVFILALAPLSWSLYSAITKPVTKIYSPVLWTFLTLTFGGLSMGFVLPFDGWNDVVAMDAWGWGLLAFLSLACTVMGFAIWTWLLRHLPATTVGFTVFLNPPMTAGFKALLAAAFPAVFIYSVSSGEYLGGILALIGVGVATLKLRQRA